MALRSGKTWCGVVLESGDGLALARFYARLLGWQLFNENETGAAVAPSETAGYNLAFETDPHYVRPVTRSASTSIRGRPTAGDGATGGARGRDE